jgi:hypothetical protein
MKYTKGRWRRDVAGFIVNNIGVAIADFDCSTVLPAEEREANKKLCLAAPKMRRALLEMRRLLANLRDQEPLMYKGNEICVEEAKYLIVDEALKGLE